MSLPRGPRAAGGVTALLLLASPGAAQQLAYGGSLQFASGRYIFQQPTRTVVLFNGLTATVGRFRANVTAPLLAQSTPWVSFGAGGMVPSGGAHQAMVGQRAGFGMGMHEGAVSLPDSGVSTHMGLGDPLLSLDVEIARASGAPPAVRLTAAAKPPLAGVERGFGTGAWDYGVGAGLARTGGAGFVFLDLAYWVLGDLTDLELENALAYSLAVGRPLTGDGRFAGLAGISGSTRIIAGVALPVQLTAGVSYRMRRGRSLGATAALGLSDAVPDLALGLTWRIAL